MVYVIQVCWQLVSRIRTYLGGGEGEVGTNVAVKNNNIYVSRRTQKLKRLVTLVYINFKSTPDDGQRNCPKHVEFYFKNKFEKLVHLVGFIIRIHHDAWSPECQRP